MLPGFRRTHFSSPMSVVPARCGGPEAERLLDQHNETLLSSQNWLSTLANHLMPHDYNATCRCVAKKSQNPTAPDQDETRPELPTLTAFAATIATIAIQS